MADGMSFEMVDKQLIGALRAVSTRMAGNKLEAAARKGAEIGRDDAERRAPRRSGKLSQNIVLFKERRRAYEVSMAWGPSPEAFYGKFQEFGTSTQPAQPFLRPSLDENEGLIVFAISAELRKALLGVGV